MKIITFSTDDPDVPSGLRAMAHFLHNGDYLPLRITAPTVERARAKAQEFWETEKAKLAKPAKTSRAPAPEPKTAVAPAPADDLDDLLG